MKQKTNLKQRRDKVELLKGLLTDDVMERYWDKVEDTGDCWLWQAYVGRQGYGVFQTHDRNFIAHRVSYVITNGGIEEETLDHLCKVRNCVNPHHLEEVSAIENTMRGDAPAAVAARRTTCYKGHPYDEGNIALYKDKKIGRLIQRVCRKCHAAACKKYDDRKRAERRANKDV